MRQHLYATTFDFLPWRDVEVHVVGFARIKFAIHAIHASCQCCGEPEVWAAGEVWCAVFDRTGACNTHHLGAVVAAVGDGYVYPGSDRFSTGFESLIRVHGWRDHRGVAAGMI